MADKLIYKGGSNVVGSSGTMKLMLPKGGGSVHRVPRWWNTKGTVAYVEAAIFNVPLDNGGTVRLVLPDVKAHMTVDIRHDGAGEFIFPKDGGLERAAVVPTDSFDIIHEYQFSKISGGSVLKRLVGNLPGSFEDGVANATFTYVVGVNNIGTVEVPQNVFTLNGVDAPDLTFAVGDSVVFDYTAVQAQHPLALFTDSSKTTPYTTGVQNQGAILLWTTSVPETLSYQCINHINMGGNITVN